MSYSSRVYRQRNVHTHDETNQEGFFSKQHDIDQDKKKGEASQPGLKVNEPGDSYEKEADSVANAVVNNAGRSPAVQQKKISSVQRLSTSAEEDRFSTNDARMKKDKDIQRAPVEAEKEKDKVQKKDEPKKDEEKVQKKDEPKKEEERFQKKGEPKKEEEKVQKKDEPKKEEEKVQKKGEPKKEEEKVQKKGEPKKEEEKVQKKDEPKKEEEKVQKKDEPKKEEEKVQKMDEPKKEEEEKKSTAVQRKPEGNTSTTPQVTDQIRQTAGKGDQLPAKALQEMSTGFGIDFSSIRIHNDTEAVNMSNQLEAQAFTHGTDIYFNEGKFDPDSSSGKLLLAHELTHTIQQGPATELNTTHTSSQTRDAKLADNVQRSWIGDRVDWVRGATDSDNWADADPPGAYYVLNGLSMDDMIRVLRGLTPAQRKKLSDNLEENGSGFDRSRLRLAMVNAATSPGDTLFRQKSEDLHWAIRTGNFATPPDGAFPILASAGSPLRRRLLGALSAEALNELVNYRNEAMTIPNEGDVTTEIHWAHGTLVQGDVVKVNGHKYVIYDDEVRTGGSVSWNTRNPGNIRSGDKYGAIPGKKYHTDSVGDFALFPDETTATMGIISVLAGYGHVTIGQAMKKYAPVGDAGNDPDKYARSVARTLGADVNTFVDTLSDEQMAIFASEIKRVEGWIPGKAFSRDDANLPEEIRKRL
ncbi:MAG: DUF4157 domain-containing protein [Ginsengibacter sp.]